MREYLLVWHDYEFERWTLGTAEGRGRSITIGTPSTSAPESRRRSANGNMIQPVKTKLSRAFSARFHTVWFPGALPRAGDDAAPFGAQQKPTRHERRSAWTAMEETRAAKKARP